jgi:hypothetical protein
VLAPVESLRDPWAFIHTLARQGVYPHLISIIALSKRCGVDPLQDIDPAQFFPQPNVFFVNFTKVGRETTGAAPAT